MDAMPNAIAYLMLAAWPVVTIVLFRRMAPGRALMASLIGGYLLLPGPLASFDLPLVPPLDKNSIPALASFACLMVVGRGAARAPFWPENRLARVLIVAYVAGPLATALGNADAVIWGRITLPPVTLKDGLGLALQQALQILPFLLARQHLASGGALRDLALALVLAALAYAPLMLAEVPLGPVLNAGLYGFQQALESQALRGESFRPVVFLPHGLWVAFLVLSATLAAFGLWRAPGGRRWQLFAGLALAGLLVVMKSFGALLMALVLVPLLVFAGRRVQLAAALALAALSLLYPVAKSAELIPERALVREIAVVDPERAYSLEFRLENEAILMRRAAERPLFGWGSWGRNHVINSATGDVETITDGRWVIAFGVYGWVGFLAEFGLLLLPILALAQAGILRRPELFSPLAAPLALILAANVLDLIPNATLTPLSWLMAGALLAHAERARSEAGAGAARPLKWKPIL